MAFIIPTTNAGHALENSPLEILNIRKAIDKGASTIRINAVHLLKIKNNPIIISKIYKAGK